MVVKQLGSKRDFYLIVFRLLQQGKNPKSISDELNIPKQNINYYLRKMKNKGLIRKVGYGTWEIVKEIEHTEKTSKKDIRGHAFIWTVKLPNKTLDWKERLKGKFDFKLIRSCIPRAFIGKKKVWFGKNTLTIFEPSSFYGTNAIESRKYAAISLIETLQAIENKLSINLSPYCFNPAREHFAIIRNDLAIQCNRNNEKIRIVDNGEGWLWIDMSDGYGELETGNKGALVNNIGVQKWWNEMKESKFEVTPKFIVNSLNQVTSNQVMFNKNFESHVGAIKELGNAAQANSKTVEFLADVIKDLKDEVINLREEISRLNKDKEEKN
jgi:hypothetical protein